MEQHEKIISLIFRAIDEVNEFLPPESRLEKTSETVLSDKFAQGALDSLGMVNFIIALEQLIDQEMGVSLSLADDLIISEQHNPFQTVGILADNISVLFKNNKMVH